MDIAWLIFVKMRKKRSKKLNFFLEKFCWFIKSAYLCIR